LVNIGLAYEKYRFFLRRSSFIHNMGLGHDHNIEIKIKIICSITPKKPSYSSNINTKYNTKILCRLFF
jgi:hypothetical protein